MNSFLIFLYPSAEQLRVKIRQNDGGLCGCKGIAILAEAVACANEVGQDFAAQVLPDLQGKGPVRQRSLSADKPFWLLLWLQK
jgi:hypothetical protein